MFHWKPKCLLPRNWYVKILYCSFIKSYWNVNLLLLIHFQILEVDAAIVHVLANNGKISDYTVMHISVINTKNLKYLEHNLVNWWYLFIPKILLYQKIINPFIQYIHQYRIIIIALQQILASYYAQFYSARFLIQTTNAYINNSCILYSYIN